MRYKEKNGSLYNEEGNIIADLFDSELNGEEHSLILASKDMYMLMNRFVLDVESNKVKMKATYKQFKILLKEIDKKCTELKM